MLSGIGRLFRRLVNRAEAPPGEPEAPEAEPAAAESPPSVGDALARDILGRTGAITVSRRTIHQARTLPTSGAPLPTYFTPAEVRRDVPTTDLPLAASRPAFPVAAQETQPPEAEQQTFFEGTTGNVAWDTLWKLRGTPSTGTAPEGKAPSEPGDAGERPSSSTPSTVQRASPLPARPPSTPLPRSVQRTPTAPPATQEDAPAAEDVDESEPPASGPARPRAMLTEIGPAQPPQRSAETPPRQPSPDRVPGPVQASPMEPTPATDGDEVGSLPPEPEEAAAERTDLDTFRPVSEGATADVPEAVETPQIEPAGTDTVQAAPVEDRPTAAPEPQLPDPSRRRVPEQREAVPSTSPDLPVMSRTESTSSSAQPAMPDVQPAAPDVQQAEPDVQQAEPDTQPTMPDVLPDSGAQAPVLDAQPAMPDAQPTMPGARSTMPDAQVTMPDMQPEMPAARPEMPGAQRAMPDAQPTISDVQPDALDVQPRAPSAEPPEPPADQKAARAPLSTAPAGERLPLVARSPDAGDVVLPGDVVQRALPSTAPPEATEEATPQEVPARHPPAPASLPQPAPRTEAPSPPVQRAETELPSVQAFRGQQATESRGVEPSPRASREAEGRTEPAMVQQSIDSREALRQALQPRIVPSTVQTAPQEAEAQAEDTGEVSEEGDEAGRDLDALARDVYRIIRRRLLVERERELGRL